MSEVVRQVRRVIGFFAVLTAVVSAHAQTCGLRDNGDGTMTDPGTGLQIRICYEGQQWTGGSKCSGGPRDYAWDDAVRRFGRGEWRMITKEEAEQVVKRSKGCSLPGGKTSTLVAESQSNGRVADHAWHVNYIEGAVGWGGSGSALWIEGVPNFV